MGFPREKADDSKLFITYFWGMLFLHSSLCTKVSTDMSFYVLVSVKSLTESLILLYIKHLLSRVVDILILDNRQSA